MKEAEKLAALRLIRTKTIGPMTYSLLVARYGSASEAVRAIPEIAKRQNRTIALARLDECKSIIEEVEQAGAQMIVKGEESYPPHLAHFDDAPPILFAKGHIALAHRPMIAIVGARNASINAMNITAAWAGELGNHGFTVISGLARGIDRAAHIGALKTGTIGVLGSGIDIIYPHENKDLFTEMSEQGLIITEMMPGTKPSPRNFPARNRIIASMTNAVLVVEAAEKSGSLITAREMGERGGEIMALPGSPFDKRAAGCNQLIKEGAHLIASVSDIIDILDKPIQEPPPLFGINSRQDLSHLDEKVVQETAMCIIKNMTIEPVDIDELARWCHVSAQLVQVALLELELSGLILRLAGNRVCLSIETS